MYLATGLELAGTACGAVEAVAGFSEDDEEEQPSEDNAIVTASNQSDLMILMIKHRRGDYTENGMQKESMLVGLFACAALIAESGGGLEWTAPPNWKAQAARPMRLDTYLVPSTSGDSDNGECGVYYFGPGQGGSVQANLDRWIGQFLQADGKPSKQAAKIKGDTIHGLKVTTVDVSGAYTGMGGPMAGAGPAKPGYRLLGAIVESSQGSVFFKFTGPAKTMAANQAAFDKMIQSVKPKS